jgi:tetratricopeptide (TPR) repeat protein
MREHNYQQAEGKLRTAVSYADLLHSASDSSKLVTSMSALARAYFLNGQTAESVKWYQKSLSTSNDLLKTNMASEQREILQEENAETLGQLGQLHYKQNQLQAASTELANSLQAYRSLGIMRNSFESRLVPKLDYARELACAAAVAYDSGKYAKAEKLCVEFQLPALLSVCTPSISDAVERVNVNALRKQGKNDQAEQLALTDAWTKASDDARFSEIQKNSDKALGEHLKALSIAQKIKNNSQMLERTYTSLSTIYLQQDDLVQARKYALMAARMGATSIELDRALLLITRLDLFSPIAVVEPETQTFLQLRRKLYGDRDPKVAAAYIMLAAIAHYNHMPSEFASYCHSAFEILNGASVSKNDRREYDANCLWLADFLFCQGRYSEAKLLYEQLLGQPDAARTAVASRLFRNAAIDSALHSDQMSMKNESTATQLLAGNTAAAYPVLRSLTPLAADLQRHNRDRDARSVCRYLKEIMLHADPQTEKDRAYGDVCRVTVDAIECSHVAPVRRLLNRVAPGSYEDIHKQ